MLSEISAALDGVTADAAQVALLVALVVGVRAGRVKSLKGSVEDLQEIVEIRGTKNEELTRDVAQLRAELRTARAELELARQETAALARHVSGEHHVEALTVLTLEHHDAVMRELELIKRHVKENRKLPRP